MSKKTDENNREFYCFISYKHRDGEKFSLDDKWAEALAFSLTQLHIPSDTKPPIDDDAFIHLNPKDDVVYPVFRDYEVLNAGGEFSQRIVSALDYSRKLVVIISDEMIIDQEKLIDRKKPYDDEKRYEKAWCFREVFCFLKKHSPDDIIPVYIGTQNDIQDIIPSILTGGLRKSDIKNGKITAKQKTEYYDYLNYWKNRNITLIYSSGVQKSIKDLQGTIAAKIAAYIFGADADQFRNYQMAEEERRQAEKKKSKVQILSGVTIGILTIVFLILSLLSNSSQVYLGKARQALSDGNRKEALQNSLRAYSMWPHTQDLTKIIWESLDPSAPYLTFESDVAISKETEEFAVIREKQYVDIYDHKTMSIIKTYDIGHGSLLKYSPIGNLLAVYSKKDLTIIDRSTDSIISKKPFKREITNVCFSQNGFYIYCDGLEQAYKLPDLETAVFSHPEIPYYSYYSNSEGSFLGTDNKLAFITKAYNISGKLPSDTLWTISVYDLSKKERFQNLVYKGNSYSRKKADIYKEMPDSVSFIGTYSNQPFIFFSTPHRINFLRLTDSLLIYNGWHRFDYPVKGWYASAESLVTSWNNSPIKIVSSIKDREGDNFILTDQRGIKYRLNSHHNIITSSPGFAEANRVSFYKRKILATQDTLNLFDDYSGNLFLGTYAPNDNQSYSKPLKGIRSNNKAEYAIQKLNGFQIVSEFHNDITGNIVKSFIYMKRDLRELQLPSIINGMNIHYLSPDMNYALAAYKKEFGIFIYKTREFIPVCSTTRHSSVQDRPIYQKGEMIFVLSISQNQSDCFDIVEVNLANKQNRNLLSDIKEVSFITDGIISVHKQDNTIMIDLNHPEKKVEYSGLLDIKKEKGFYSISRRTDISNNSYSSIQDHQIFISSIHLKTMPASENDAIVYTTPKGQYVFELRFISQNKWHDTVKYTFLKAETLTPVVEITGDIDYYSFRGISSDEKFFYYVKNGVLVIYDLEKGREITTTFRLDREKIEQVAIFNNLLFFPGNTFKIIDLSNGNEIISLPELNFNRRNLSVSFSPNKRWLLVDENLIDLDNKQVMSNSIPIDDDRILTNEYIVYYNKVIVLPHKKNLVKLAKHQQNN